MGSRFNWHRAKGLGRDLTTSKQKLLEWKADQILNTAGKPKPKKWWRKRRKGKSK